MTNPRIALVLFAVSLVLSIHPQEGLPRSPENQTTGIMGAISEEMQRLEAALAGAKEEAILGVRFVTGTLRGRRIVIASSGVGKVNAAMTATLMIDHFKPKEILFSGIAGAIGPDLRPGDIVIAEKTAQHDLGNLTPEGIQLRGMRNPVDWDRNPVFFDADARLIALAENSARNVKFEKVKAGEEEASPRVIRGIVVTGDVFVASESKKLDLRKTMKADAVEMEGAAVAQICYQFKVPWLIIRSISDSAGTSARQETGDFMTVAAGNSALLVMDIVGRLASR